MTTETTTNIIEFPLTNEIKELGIPRVYTGLNYEGDKTIMLFVQRSDIEKPLSCKYDKRFKNVAKEIETVLCDSGFDKKAAKKFIALFGKVWIEIERQRQQTQRDIILEEIRKRRNGVKFSSVEEWQRVLTQKYNELHDTVLANMPELWIGLEFELSVLRVLNIFGNTLPFIGILLARAGTGKTQIISLLDGWYCTYYTDNFTAQALVSHSTALSEEELEKNDMLPSIKNRLFLTPEFAPIFTLKDEDLNKSLGMITRIADGHGYRNNSGAHGQRGYGSSTDGLMFTWLGAAVDIPYRVYKMLGYLGFKLYFFRLPYEDDTEDELLFGMSDDFNSQISRIRTALYEYLYTFEMGPHLIYDNELNKVKWDNSKDVVDAKRYIVKLGILIQHLRCIATTWHTEGTRDSDYGYSVSQAESPKRAIRALFNLAKGHALSTGRNYITLDDVPIVVKTVLSTALIDRVGLFYMLINNGGKSSTDDITSALNVTRHTALRTMTELKAIGLVEMYDQKEPSETQYTKHIRLKDRFSWFLSPEFEKLREGFVPVDNRKFMEDPRRQSKANAECSPPYTHNKEKDITEDQINIFLSVFRTIENEQQKDGTLMEIDKDTIGGAILRQRLIETGKFEDNDIIDTILASMIKFGRIEKVSCDTYRRRKEN